MKIYLNNNKNLIVIAKLDFAYDKCSAPIKNSKRTSDLKS